MSNLTAPLDAALTRLALHDLRCTYSHAADRCDEPLLFSVFHPDAVIDVPGGGPVSRWIPTIMAELRANYVTTSHVISNEYDEVSGDVAVAESYIVLHSLKAGDPPTKSMTGGRYLDRYERRDGEWKIALRRFVEDWTTVQPVSREEAEACETLLSGGGRSRDHPFADLWAERAKP